MYNVCVCMYRDASVLDASSRRDSTNATDGTDQETLVSISFFFPHSFLFILSQTLVSHMTIILSHFPRAKSSRILAFARRYGAAESRDYTERNVEMALRNSDECAYVYVCVCARLFALVNWFFSLSLSHATQTLPQIPVQDTWFMKTSVPSGALPRWSAVGVCDQIPRKSRGCEITLSWSVACRGNAIESKCTVASSLCELNNSTRLYWAFGENGVYGTILVNQQWEI